MLPSAPCRNLSAFTEVSAEHPLREGLGGGGTRHAKSHFSALNQPPFAALRRGSLRQEWLAEPKLRSSEGWRPRPELNRGTRICSPLRHHSATWPSRGCLYRTWCTSTTRRKSLRSLPFRRPCSKKPRCRNISE